MATYRVLYWQEIPSQIKAEDDDGGEASVLMPPKFAARIDDAAMERGLRDADDYLAQWRWSEEQERNGSAEDVADAVRAELEAAAQW
jgi:hypothetical protein